MLSWPLFLLLQAPFTSPDGVRTDDMRCGTSLIKLGDTAATVESACGAPTRKTPLLGKRGRAALLSRIGERWTYDLGPTQFTRLLDFTGGRVYSMRTADYGTSD